MAIKRSLIIKGTNTMGEEESVAVTHVNPTATNQNLDTWSRAFNALSGNTYADTIRVDSESLTEALAD